MLAWLCLASVFYFKEISKIKNFKEYQEEAIRSLRPETDLERLGLLLVSHVGAVSKLKYAALKSGVMNTDDLCIELGECLWCVAAIGHLLDINDVEFSFENFESGDTFIFSTLAQSSGTIFQECLGDEDDDENNFVFIEYEIKCILWAIPLIAKSNDLSLSEIIKVNLAKARP
jgi:hypothetical protein